MQADSCLSLLYGLTANGLLLLAILTMDQIGFGRRKKR